MPSVPRRDNSRPPGICGAVEPNGGKPYNRRATLSRDLNAGPLQSASGGSVAQTDTVVSEYAHELIAVPRAHVRVELRQDDNGLALLHDGRSLVECALTSEGMMAAGFVAKALGVNVPALGQSVVARVSTGVLYRAIGISGLDFGKEESYILLERLLEEAELQRGGSSDAV